MREIKFRYIFEDIKEDGRTLVTQIWNLNDIEINDIVYDTEVLISRNQYTGLKDKNDVEIYEGDILRQTSSENKDIIHIVRYSEDDASFLANNIKLGKDYTCSLNKQWCIKKEVIGNIYENQELLES